MSEFKFFLSLSGRFSSLFINETGVVQRLSHHSQKQTMQKDWQIQCIGDGMGEIMEIHDIQPQLGQSFRDWSEFMYS